MFVQQELDPHITETFVSLFVRLPTVCGATLSCESYGREAELCLGSRQEQILHCVNDRIPYLRSDEAPIYGPYVWVEQDPA